MFVIFLIFFFVYLQANRSAIFNYEILGKGGAGAKKKKKIHDGPFAYQSSFSHLFI